MGACRIKKERVEYEKFDTVNHGGFVGLGSGVCCKPYDEEIE
jgi:hypothetical protein